MQLGLADPDGALIDAVDRTRRFARGVADESGDALEEEEYPDDDVRRAEHPRCRRRLCSDNGEVTPYSS